jgi:hypothetical protein
MIILVLMGGGAALLSARPSAECRDARQRNPLDADRICRSSGGGAHGSGGGVASRGYASVERGGFGGFFGRIGG